MKIDKKLLIAGVDPGETKSFALLDIDGNLIKASSSKGYTLESLLREISSYGRVLIVGTDVNPCPKFVKKIAKSLRADLYVPEENLLVRKKMSLNNEFRKESNIKLKNKHQKDALAIAILALKSVKPLFNKIELHLQQRGKQHLDKQVKERVLLDKMPINKVLAMEEFRER